MANNLPSRTLVRPEKQLTKTTPPGTLASTSPEISAPPTQQHSAGPPVSSVLVLDRRVLLNALRFASRVASRAPIEALRGALFGDGSLVVTDLDIALRASIQDARDLGVLVPAEPLKRCLSGSQRSEVEIAPLVPTEARPFAVSVDGAILSGHDPRDFPDPSVLLPDVGVRAQARFHTLEPVLVAAAIEDSRKAMNAIYFQCCRNLVIGTDGHRLHALGIESSDRGDFLVPRKAIELVENVRRATRSTDVQADFYEHQALFRIANFEVAVRLEAEAFPAYQEVIPSSSKHALRIEKTALLEALDRIAAVLNDRARGVRLRKVADGLEIAGRKTGAGELTITVAASGWEEGETLGLNLSYLHDAVRFVRSEDLVIGLTDENTPIKIVDGLYLALVMPLRLEKGGVP